jgi:hypothetical protein
MRGRALAHLPLMAPDAAALAAVRGSGAFRGAPPDRWPDAGLPADAQDFAWARVRRRQPAPPGRPGQGGVADALGLKPGDVQSVDGKPVKNGWDLKALLRAAAGRAVQLELERDSKRETKGTVPASLAR